MDAPITIPKPANISLPQASAAGVGILTASLGVFDGLQVPLPNVSCLPDGRDEWALVFGGAGSVGQFAVQLLKVSGFKVVATCSTKSFDVRLPRTFLSFSNTTSFKSKLNQPRDSFYAPSAQM